MSNDEPGQVGSAAPTPNYDAVHSVRDFVEDLDEFCGSDALSLQGLREKMQRKPPDFDIYSPGIIQESTCCILHEACANKNVSLDIIKYLLAVIPGGANMTSTYFDEHGDASYPIHLACLNNCCPRSVIETLLDANPSALEHICVVDDGGTIHDYDGYSVSGLPLHYYLARSSNIDLDVVKLLVRGFQGATDVCDDDTKCTPLHMLLLNTGHIPNRREIVEFLVESGSSLQCEDFYDRISLHVACSNENMDPRVVETLLRIWPEATRQREIGGHHLPLHNLCENKSMDEGKSVEILKALIDADPDSIYMDNGDNDFAIHLAAEYKSPAFCKVLLDRHPDFIRMEGNSGTLPFHQACRGGRLSTVSYLYNLYPESISIQNGSGQYPIHEAASCVSKEKVELLQFLLMHDPDGASRYSGEGILSDRDLPLHILIDCGNGNHVPDIDCVELMYDAYPEAIYAEDRHGKTPIDYAREGRHRSDAAAFFDAQLWLLDDRVLATHGWLPIHRALYTDAPLGTIKMLVKKGPLALQVADNEGRLPLFLACGFASAKVVRYLVEDCGLSLNATDTRGNSPLHCACQRGNCDAVDYLLEKNPAAVSEMNQANKLPIHVLCESVKVRDCGVDSENPKLTQSIWLLLVACPETILNF